MVKNIIGVVLIVIAAGGYFYLDMRNKEEIQAAEDARKEMDALRARAAAAAAAAAANKQKFEAQLMAELNACKETATKAKDEFLAQKRKKAQQKAAQAEADKTLEAANAACQATYDGKLAAGQ